LPKTLSHEGAVVEAVASEAATEEEALHTVVVLFIAALP